MPDGASDPASDPATDHALAKAPHTDIGLRIAAAHRRADRLFNKAYRHLGFGNAHAQILHALLEFGEMRVIDVAHRTGLDPSTVGRLVKELGRKKLVKRRVDPSDGRARILSAGARAHDLRAELEMLRDGVNRRLRGLLAGPDPDDRAPSDLADALDRLADLP